MTPNAAADSIGAVPLVIIIIAAVAYLLGSIPFGLLVARARGVDIRQHGSRNIGATNVWRVLGKTWGLITFFGDLAKGVVAVLLGKWIAARELAVFAESHVAPIPFDPAFAGIAAAIGCILGHNFPIWLRFKGGKGVATSLGVIFGMMPLAALLTFAIWGIVFKASRYVSLASIVAGLALPVVIVALMLIGPRDGFLSVHGWGYFYFGCAAGLLVIVRHRDNIKRLVAGTENRFGTPKDGPSKGNPPSPNISTDETQT